jgi:hypothetical protein
MARKIFSYYGRSEFHNKMLKIFVGISLLQGAFFFMGAHMVMLRLEGLAGSDRLPATASDFAAVLRTEQTFLYLMVLVSVLISTAVFVYLGLRYSHDAAGAIYRIKKDLVEMTEKGEVKRLNTRKNDYFKDVEEAINNFIDKIKHPTP